MFFVVIGILQPGSNGLLLVVLLAAGAGVLLWFFLHAGRGATRQEVPTTDVDPRRVRGHDRWRRTVALPSRGLVAHLAFPPGLVLIGLGVGTI
jgi:hypothetical protein